MGARTELPSAGTEKPCVLGEPSFFQPEGETEGLGGSAAVSSSSEARVVPHGISRASGAHDSGKSGQKCNTERFEVHLRCQGLQYSGLLMPTADRGKGRMQALLLASRQTARKVVCRRQGSRASQGQG